MARLKKPHALKELHGTDKRNKTRHNFDQPIPDRGIGEAPEKLDDQRRAIWDELVLNMYPGCLGEGDRIAMETLTRLVYRMRNDFDNMGDSAIANLIRLLGHFGMTPSSRNNIKVKPGKKGNPFESI